MTLIFGAAGFIHAAIYICLLLAFGISLLPRHEAVVTKLAHIARGELNAELITYTRGVTLMWCAFFIAELCLSFILYHEATRAVWLIFVSAMNLPLVALVFVSEYIWRRIRLRHYPHESLIETIRLGRQFRQAAFKRAR